MSENKSVKLLESAANLVSQMTLEEKVTQLGNQAPAIPRLGIPAYNYWSEASHGYFGPFQMKQMDVTSYPVCLAMSQSWDTDKMEEVAGAISDEIQAQHNVNGVELHMWCPTINMARDPRNGRSDENFGEDPYLTGQLAAAYVRGMQGDDDTYLKTIATPKHYALNSSENNRHKGSSNVDEATLREYYTKAFEYAVRKGHAKSIMTSYNRINGVPASANEELLTTFLREEWGFDGFVVSDCGAVLDMYENPMFNGGETKQSGHYYAKSATEASAMSLLAGTDMSCGTEHKKNLLEAIEEGMIEESVLDRSLIRILASRYALGLLEEEDPTPYRELGAEDICDDKKKQLALEMANESIVLLKNDRQLLPIQPEEEKRILVIGPNGIYRELGGYSAGSMSKIIETVVNITPLEGITEEASRCNMTVAYEKGWCTDKESGAGGVMNTLPGAGAGGNMMDTVHEVFGEDADLGMIMMAFMSPDKFAPEDADHEGDATQLWNRAKAAAKDADYCIFIAGTDASTAAEEHDRMDIALPYGQDEKIQEILDINENTIVVLNTLGAVTGGFFDKAHTIVNAHFAGQVQGTAIANVLFGKVNPQGKLTATWYQSTAQLPHVNDYGIYKNDTLDGKGRTYMYLEGEPLFPFGYGMSYTEYEYSNLRLSKESYEANEEITLTLDVTNVGKMTGTEIVQCYVRREQEEGIYDKKPLRQLKAFARITLQPQETGQVTLTIPVKEISFWSNRKKQMVVEPGSYVIELGTNSAQILCSSNIILRGNWKEELLTVTAVSERSILTVGDHTRIRPSVVVDNKRHLSQEEYSVDYISSDETVIEVDDKGQVAAVGVGVANVAVCATLGEDRKEWPLVFAVTEK